MSLGQLFGSIFDRILKVVFSIPRQAIRFRIQDSDIPDAQSLGEETNLDEFIERVYRPEDTSIRVILENADSIAGDEGRAIIHGNGTDKIYELTSTDPAEVVGIPKREKCGTLTQVGGSIQPFDEFKFHTDVDPPTIEFLNDAPTGDFIVTYPRQIIAFLLAFLMWATAGYAVVPVEGTNIRPYSITSDKLAVTAEIQLTREVNASTVRIRAKTLEVQALTSTGGGQYITAEITSPATDEVISWSNSLHKWVNKLFTSMGDMLRSVYDPHSRGYVETAETAIQLATHPANFTSPASGEAVLFDNSGNLINSAVIGRKGDKGDTGEQGIQGIPGPHGITGETGAVGPAGTPGAKGDTGEQGIQGITGETGIQGPKGDTGESGVFTGYSKSECDATIEAYALKLDGTHAMQGDLDMGNHDIINLNPFSIKFSNGSSLNAGSFGASGEINATTFKSHEVTYFAPESELTQETQNREQADSNLSSQLTDEIRARGTAEGLLQGGIDNVSALLTNEIHARSTAEGLLQNGIDGVSASLTLEIQHRATSVEAEALARSEECATLFKTDGSRAMSGDLDMGDHDIINLNPYSIKFSSGGSVDGTQFNASGEINAKYLSSHEVTYFAPAQALTDEITARLIAEGVLQGGIDNVSALLTNEISARSTAEGILQGNINSLSGQLTIEVNRATAEEALLQAQATATSGQLTSEINRAISAEAAINTSVASYYIPYTAEAYTSQYWVDGGIGNDTTADGSMGKPFKTIQACLNFIGQPVSMPDYKRHVKVYIGDNPTAVAGVTGSWDAYQENLVVPTRNITLYGAGVKLGEIVYTGTSPWGKITCEFSAARKFGTSSSDYRPQLTLIGLVNARDSQNRIANAFHVEGGIRFRTLSRTLDTVQGDGNNTITAHLTAGQSPYVISITPTYPADPLIHIKVTGTTDYDGNYIITSKVDANTFIATRSSGTNAHVNVVSGQFYETDTSYSTSVSTQAQYTNCYVTGKITVDDGTVNTGELSVDTHLMMSQYSRFYGGIEGRNIGMSRTIGDEFNQTFIIGTLYGGFVDTDILCTAMTIPAVTNSATYRPFLTTRFTTACAITMNASQTVNMDSITYCSFLSNGCSWATNIPTISLMDQGQAIKNNSTVTGTTESAALTWLNTNKLGTAETAYDTNRVKTYTVTFSAPTSGEVIAFNNVGGLVNAPASLGAKGDKGDTGPQGIQGIPGIQGPTGEIGLTGPTGEIGLTGPQGIQGITGEVGPKGDKGDTGESGVFTGYSKIETDATIEAYTFSKLEASQAYALLVQKAGDTFEGDVVMSGNDITWVGTLSANTVEANNLAITSNTLEVSNVKVRGKISANTIEFGDPIEAFVNADGQLQISGEVKAVNVQVGNVTAETYNGVALSTLATTASMEAWSYDKGTSDGRYVAAGDTVNINVLNVNTIELQDAFITAIDNGFGIKNKVVLSGGLVLGDNLDANSFGIDNLSVLSGAGFFAGAAGLGSDGGGLFVTGVDGWHSTIDNLTVTGELTIGTHTIEITSPASSEVLAFTPDGHIINAKIGGGSGGDSNWTLLGNDISNNNSGGVKITGTAEILGSLKVPTVEVSATTKVYETSTTNSTDTWRFDDRASGEVLATIPYVGDGSDPLNTWRLVSGGHQSMHRCAAKASSLPNSAGMLYNGVNVVSSGAITRIPEHSSGIFTATFEVNTAAPGGDPSYAWFNVDTTNNNYFTGNILAVYCSGTRLAAWDGAWTNVCDNASAITPDKWSKVVVKINHDADTAEVLLDGVSLASSGITTDNTIGNVAVLLVGSAPTSPGFIGVDNVTYDGCTVESSTHNLVLADAVTGPKTLAELAAGGGDSNWTLSGNRITNNNSGPVKVSSTLEVGTTSEIYETTKIVYPADFGTFDYGVSGEAVATQLYTGTNADPLYTWCVPPVTLGLYRGLYRGSQYKSAPNSFGSNDYTTGLYSWAVSRIIGPESVIFSITCEIYAPPYVVSPVKAPQFNIDLCSQAIAEKISGTSYVNINFNSANQSVNIYTNSGCMLTVLDCYSIETWTKLNVRFNLDEGTVELFNVSGESLGVSSPVLPLYSTSNGPLSSVLLSSMDSFLIDNLEMTGYNPGSSYEAKVLTFKDSSNIMKGEQGIPGPKGDTGEAGGYWTKTGDTIENNNAGNVIIAGLKHQALPGGASAILTGVWGETTPYAGITTYCDPFSGVGQIQLESRQTGWGLSKGSYGSFTEDTVQFVVRNDTGGASLSLNTTAGITLVGTTEITQSLGVGNMATGLSKDTGENLVLTDAVTGSKTLAQLAAGGGEFTDGGEAKGKARTLGNTDDYALSFLQNNTPKISLDSSSIQVIQGDWYSTGGSGLQMQADQVQLSTQAESGVNYAGVTMNTDGVLQISGASPAGGSSLTLSLTGAEITGTAGLKVDGTLEVTQSLGVGNMATGLSKDSSEHLVLTDAVTGSKTLAQLAAGGGSSMTTTEVQQKALGATQGTNTLTGAQGAVIGDTNTETGWASFISGYNNAEGGYGAYNLAGGGSNVLEAQAQGCAVFGTGNKVSNYNTVSFGNACWAQGNNSLACGYNTWSCAAYDFALGRWNVGAAIDSAAWNPTDPLFEIGIGADVSHKANAVTVLKNGNVGIGIATPTQPLDVNGGIKATTVETAGLITANAFKGDGSQLTGVVASTGIHGSAYLDHPPIAGDRGDLAMQYDSVSGKGYIAIPGSGISIYAVTFDDTNQLYFWTQVYGDGGFSKPIGRGYASAYDSTHRYIYFMGGNDDRTALASMVRYNIAANTVEALADMPWACYGAAAVYTHEVVCLIGGKQSNGLPYDDSGATYGGQVQEYDTTSNTWTTIVVAANATGATALGPIDYPRVDGINTGETYMVGTTDTYSTNLPLEFDGHFGELATAVALIDPVQNVWNWSFHSTPANYAGAGGAVYFKDNRWNSISSAYADMAAWVGEDGCIRIAGGEHIRQGSYAAYQSNCIRKWYPATSTVWTVEATFPLDAVQNTGNLGWLHHTQAARSSAENKIFLVWPKYVANSVPTNVAMTWDEDGHIFSNSGVNVATGINAGTLVMKGHVAYNYTGLYLINPNYSIWQPFVTGWAYDLDTDSTTTYSSSSRFVLDYSSLGLSSTPYVAVQPRVATGTSSVTGVTNTSAILEADHLVNQDLIPYSSPSANYVDYVVIP